MYGSQVSSLALGGGGGVDVFSWDFYVWRRINGPADSEQRPERLVHLVRLSAGLRSKTLDLPWFLKAGRPTASYLLAFGTSLFPPPHLYLDLMQNYFCTNPFKKLFMQSS